MANKKFLTGAEETKTAYKFNPIKFGLSGLLQILLGIVLLVLGAYNQIFAILFLIYLIVIIVLHFKGMKQYFTSIISRGKNNYKFSFKSKGLFREKEIKFKK